MMESCKLSGISHQMEVSTLFSGWLKERLKHLAAHLLQMQGGPRPKLDSAKRAAFEALWAGVTGTITYDLPYPKYEFLRYLVETKDVILHGSNRPDLTRLEPRRQTTFFGRQVEAVFGTPDEIWCLFYAVVNGRDFRGSKRTICLRVTGRGGSVRKFYWFSLSQPMLERSDAFCDGMVYILPRRTFTPGEIADEWTSAEAVAPIAQLPVQPREFPFLAAITGHSDAEGPWRFYGRMLWPRRRATRP